MVVCSTATAQKARRATLRPPLILFAKLKHLPRSNLLRSEQICSKLHGVAIPGTKSAELTLNCLKQERQADEAVWQRHSEKSPALGCAGDFFLRYAAVGSAWPAAIDVDLLAVRVRVRIRDEIDDRCRNFLRLADMAERHGLVEIVNIHALLARASSGET